MEFSKQRLNEISKDILDASFEVHKTMGLGLLESVYAKCLDHELKQRELKSELEVAVPLRYKNVTLSEKLRIDLLVEERIIIELKTVESILPVHEAQILSYLKLAEKRLGFLVNFYVAKIKDGFKRFVNNF
ncbi:MAG: GxxExxY protein [Candidatus Marinimicrobia bacterium]|nr:GxxExxY protein [Candidatus Neomarinimicrobiota bacterium]MCF7829510.1 GxxExxY protein [Candidatus Neomarinimicrobiota bacterium]MCF7880092.1 GxxExxY protein [Candidatus Neomarinimicrobiota bacterium]